MKKYLFLALIFWAGKLLGQQPSSIKEYNKELTTYPFNQPDPVPNPSAVFYPYYRFDGYAHQPSKKSWKIVALENDFIKILITPEIGGKIWTAIDKKNNKPFIYNNDAVKFRDIAMCGPWTSGGLEANFGIMGHTPGVATPVNYMTYTDADGSAVCLISLLDLITKTRWNMQIILPNNTAYFITRFLWHNQNATQQPYYTWMNLGEKVTDSLEYIFPGNHYLFHDGKAYNYPKNIEKGKDISKYDQNDFGSYKSYHVTGTYSKYFGVFWQKENYGMIHFAERQDKIGKKVWIWGLSRQGMIWEKLLTDRSGQYTEIQSGRLFNQNSAESVATPFKQFDFLPYTTDVWDEYWYPFQNTDGVAGADLNGVVNIINKDKKTILKFSAVKYIKDTILVWGQDGKLLQSIPVNMKPLENIQQEITTSNINIVKITLTNNIVLMKNDGDAKDLSRPVASYSNIDEQSAYGLYLKGIYQSGIHQYVQAENNIRASLDMNPSYIPALSEMAFLQYRKMHYDSAFIFAKKALSVDTYDAKANYYYGLAATQLHQEYDAKDGFQVAAITTPYRSAAFTELSKIAIRQGLYQEAAEYARKSLVNNTNNITALQLLYICAEKLNNKEALKKWEQQLLQLDPINHFVRFENFWQNKNEQTKLAFTSLIRDELPYETYLDLAIWFADLNLWNESKTAFNCCPQKNDEIYYWLAWLHKDEYSFADYLKLANNGNPIFVFPFRNESKKVLLWAMQKTDNWKPGYYLSLIEAFYQNTQEALSLVDIKNPPSDFAPFYVYRSKLRDNTNETAIENDLKTAFAIDKSNDWRYAKYLSSFYLKNGQPQKAISTLAPIYKNNPNNYAAGLLYIQALMRTEDYVTAEKIMSTIQVLPNEGAKDAHKFYEQTKLMLTLQLLEKKNYKAALQKINEARLWPENLGVGAPYAEDSNETLENEIQSLINDLRNGQALSKDLADRIKNKILSL